MSNTKQLSQNVVDNLRPQARRYDTADIGSRNSILGLIVRVEPSGRKTWYVRYRLKGHRRMMRIGDASSMTLTRARANARSIIAQSAEAELGRAEDPANIRAKAPKMPTLGEYIEEQYARALSSKKSGTPTLERLRHCFSESQIWAMKLNDTDLAQSIVHWREDRLDAGRMKSTVNRDASALRAALSHAVDAGVLDSHPMQRVRPIRETQEHRVRYLSDDEECRLWDALDRREERIRAERDSANGWRAERGHALLSNLRAFPYVDHIKPIVTLAVHTGMRRGELFSLEWRDIDFDIKILTVRGHVAKSGKARRIPLNQTAIRMLEHWGSMQPRSGFVFKSPKSGGRLDNIKKAWEAVMKDAGIEDFRFHDLRHHFASCLVMAGVPLNTVREVLGHSSLTMTLRYAHLAPEAGHDAVARLDNRYGGLESSP